MLRAAQVACKTDTGRQRRGNEDSAYARPPLFVVADGMGGAQAGEVASQIAVDAFAHALPDGASTEERLAERVREANRRIHEQARADRDRAGMGTTLTAAYLEDSCLVIAHVGDSRAYLMREGRLRRLTRDHSLVGELVERGKLTEEQAAEHPQRSVITRALGIEADVEVDTWTYPARSGDVLLLCSDGLTSMVAEEQVGEILAGARDLDRAADELIAAANEAGGRDNITVILFLVEEVQAADGQTTLIGGLAPGLDDAGESPSRAPETAALATEAPASGRRPASAVQERRHAVAHPTTEMRPVAAGAASRAARRQRFRDRTAKPAAAVISVTIVLALILAGGYLATRQLYFIGTDSQGVVTIYRGLPYDLPLGIHLYETVYVSGVPAVLIPADRRSTVLDNHLRSQNNAISVVRALELGQISQ